MKEVKHKPTKEETAAAVELQRPIQSEDKPATVLQRSNTFAQLAKVSRDARITFGGNTQWAKPEQLFNDKYREGLESVPFFITRAWKFNSKGGYGERLGLEIVLSGGQMYSFALPYREGDIKRNDILAAFKDRGAPPLGPVCMTRLSLNRGNDYYDIVPFENVINTTEGIDIPFVEINNDDVPF